MPRYSTIYGQSAAGGDGASVCHSLRLTSLLYVSRTNRWLLFGLLMVVGVITAMRIDPFVAHLLHQLVPGPENATIAAYNYGDNERLHLTMCLLSVTMVTMSFNMIQEAVSLARPHIRINVGAVAALGWLLVFDVSSYVGQLVAGMVLLLLQCPAESIWRLLPHVYAEHAPAIHLYGTLLPYVTAMLAFTLIGTERMFTTTASQIIFLLASTLMCGFFYWSNDRIAPIAATNTVAAPSVYTYCNTCAQTLPIAPSSSPGSAASREHFDRRTADALAKASNDRRLFVTGPQIARSVKSTLAIMFFNALLLNTSCTLDRILLIVHAHTTHRFSLAYFPVLATFAAAILSYVCASAYHYLRATYEASIDQVNVAPPSYESAMLMNNGRVRFGPSGGESCTSWSDGGAASCALHRQLRWFRIAWMLGGLMSLITAKLVIIWASYATTEPHVCVIAATLLGGAEMVKAPLLDAINRLALSQSPMVQQDTPAIHRLNGTISAILVSCGCLVTLPYTGPWILSATLSFCLLVALLTVVGSRALDEFDSIITDATTPQSATTCFCTAAHTNNTNRLHNATSNDNNDNGNNTATAYHCHHHQQQEQQQQQQPPHQQHHQQSQSTMRQMPATPTRITMYNMY